ncbi:DUF6884 domain-containing protein [Saccharothrix sp. NPDC042600]|uniref:DUF6884 domain-containing protein n=1 Tax=Saccharothrix TaxID=2071 RepID=UPI0033F135D0|nr:hypothetical protein GCM10017745_46720 [Saccharothrix mutabilis subsp. capreolus]
MPDTAPTDVPRQLFVVPCGRAKLDIPAPARQLYTGPMFRFCLAVVEQEAALVTEAGIPARVLILSARHGLLDPDTQIAPYEQTMTAPGAVTARRLADNSRPSTPITTPRSSPSCPRHTWPDSATPSNWSSDARHAMHLRDAYDAAPGIGHQRRILSQLRLSQAARRPRLR